MVLHAPAGIVAPETGMTLSWCMAKHSVLIGLCQQGTSPHHCAAICHASEADMSQNDLQRILGMLATDDTRKTTRARTPSIIGCNREGGQLRNAQIDYLRCLCSPTGDMSYLRRSSSNICTHQTIEHSIMWPMFIFWANHSQHSCLFPGTKVTESGDCDECIDMAECMHTRTDRQLDGCLLSMFTNAALTIRAFEHCCAFNCTRSSDF